MGEDSSTGIRERFLAPKLIVATRINQLLVSRFRNQRPSAAPSRRLWHTTTYTYREGPIPNSIKWHGFCLGRIVLCGDLTETFEYTKWLPPSWTPKSKSSFKRKQCRSNEVSSGRMEVYCRSNEISNSIRKRHMQVTKYRMISSLRVWCLSYRREWNLMQRVILTVVYNLRDYQLQLWSIGH